MYRGKRYRIPANEFAIPRMEPGKQRPIQSMEEARDWERILIGEIKAGRDPSRPPGRAVQAGAGAQLANVATFLDAYMERCVKPAGLRDVELATMHRALEMLRAAITGVSQTPPMFEKSPFHRFGVRLNKKAETVCDRRLSRDEEKQLLDAALQKMNTPEHGYVGPLPHDRIIGALELCCRRGEMLPIQNKRVNWETCQIGIPGATAKDRENRRIPFNPSGRLAAILERRAALGPDAFVFGTANGTCQPNIQTAWEALKLLAHGIEPKPGQEGEKWNREQLQRIDLRWHDLRHEGACRCLRTASIFASSN